MNKEEHPKYTYHWIVFIVLVALVIFYIKPDLSFIKPDLSFTRVREASRLKAVTNNLRQIAAGGQQYILENDATAVSYGQLEGEYFSKIQAVYDETYSGLVIYAEGGVLRVTSTVEGEVAYTY